MSDHGKTERSADVVDEQTVMSRKVPECPNGQDAHEPPAIQVLAGVNDAQLRAIDLLIMGTSPGKAAKACGVDRRTLYRWRYEYEPFRAELDRRRREMWDATSDRMRTLIRKSLDVLAVELRDEYDMSRFRAAGMILRASNVRKLIEDQMTDRDRGGPRGE